MAPASGKEVVSGPDEFVYLMGNVGMRGFGVYDEG